MVKQWVAWDALFGNGKTLLLPSLHVIQSKGIEIFLLPNEPDFNKVLSTWEFGCPKQLCNILFICLSSIQTRESKGKVRQIVEEDKCSGKSHPTLGPFRIIFPDTWSCTVQPKQENWTL